MAMQQSGSLPGGAPLAQGEARLVGGRFMLSTLAFYLNTDLVLTNRRLYAVRPNVLFGLIPVGRAQSNFPIENIAGVSANTRFDLLGVLLGIFGIVLGIIWVQMPGIAVLGAIFIVLGVVVIIGAPKQAIEVMNSGGGVIRFPVSVLDRSRTLGFANRVSEAVARTSRGGRTSVESSIRSPAARADPTEALGHLSKLREQGLISDSEYASKRAEILARL